MLSGCRPTIKCRIRSEVSARHSRFRRRRFYVWNTSCHQDSASERSSISSQHLQNFEINLSGCNAFRRYNPMAQQQDALYLSSSLHDFPDHSWADSMQNCKNFAQSSAISNDLGWTEDRFQPPKSHQIVDSLPHQIKSSLFSSLFRTCES